MTTKMIEARRFGNLSELATQSFITGFPVGVLLANLTAPQRRPAAHPNHLQILLLINWSDLALIPPLIDIVSMRGLSR
jgi:hypothetical protein